MQSKKNTQVFEGNELRTIPPVLPEGEARCFLPGVDQTGREVGIPLSNNLLSQHILFLGGVGTGKTNAIFHLLAQLRQTMTSNDVVVIFDTKGDYYEEFYQNGDVVISNDNKSTGLDRINYWNIFRELDENEGMEESIIEIGRTLFYEKTQRSQQPFFPNAARDLFTAILLHYCRSSERSKMTNARLRDFLDRSTASDIRNILSEHDDLRAITSYIADDRSPQTQGVISELQQMVREVFVGNFRRDGTLAIRGSVRRKSGRAIFIEYDLGIGNMLTPIYRLLLDLALKEALSRQKSEGNVWFIIDEFRLVPNLQHVDDGINFGRSLGTKFIIGVQNVEQLFHSYGESLALSILSGFMTNVAFRVNDVTTRSFIQGIFGKNRKRESYMPSVQTRGLVEEVREANVVEDWDITNLPVGKAIVGLPGQEPFLLQIMIYQ